jgi:hypothetical protein
MRVHSSTRYLALAALAGALACAGNKARTDNGPDQAAAARDTTSGRDTLSGRDTTQNPPGYRGMERDTTIAPQQQQTPSDTFLQQQGQGTPQDTAGYSGIERVDTTGQRADTSGYNANPGAAPDTSGMSGMDSTGMHHDSTGANSGAAGLDSTGMSKSGDTTGYKQSQDTTTAR